MAIRLKLLHSRTARHPQHGSGLLSRAKRVPASGVFVRIQQRAEYIALGRAILEKLCKQEGVDFGEKPFGPIVKNFQAASLEDLFANIGASLQSARDVFYTLFQS